MSASLLLTPTDGTGIELLDRSVDGIYLARDGSEDILANCAEIETEWASSPDSEGAFPTRSKPLNLERSGRVWLTAASESALETLVETWLATLAEVSEKGGTLTYTTATGKSATLGIWKAVAQRVGADPIFRGQGKAESTFTLTCEPFWELTATTVNITALIGSQTNATTVTSTEPLLAFLAPDPGGSAPAKVKITVTDTASQDRSHLEGGVDPNYSASAPVLFDAGPVITLANPSAAADDIIDTTAAHGLSAGDRVWFTSLTGGTGLSTNTAYYVIAANLGSTTFQVSTTAGGTAVDFSSDITAGTAVSLGKLTPLAASVNTALSGEYGSSSLKTTLTTTPVALCTSGPQLHVGSYRHRPRLYGAGTGPIWVRLAYKVGSSPAFRETDWVELPGLSAWYEVDLGLMQIPEAVQGTQTCEWRVEAYSETPGDTLDVDYDALIPAGPYFKARTPAEILVSTTFAARSEFTTESGAITGDSLALGGTWQGAGDADDFSVAAGVATRTAVSDGGTVPNARLVVASGTAALTDTMAQVETKTSALATTSASQGLLLRYVDSSNFLAVSLALIPNYAPQVTIRMVVGGSMTVQESRVATGVAAAAADRYVRLNAHVSASGSVVAWVDGVAQLGVTNSALAVGGTLDDGKVGLFDWQPSSTALTRTYRSFISWASVLDRTIYASSEAQVRSDRILREHSSGEWGRLDSEGGYPTLLPGRQSRVVLKARRNDTDELPADNISDSLRATCEITPRVGLI